MIKILIVDDHPIVAKGLKSLLDEQEDMTVIALAHSGASVAVNDLNIERAEDVVDEIGYESDYAQGRTADPNQKSVEAEHQER